MEKLQKLRGALIDMDGVLYDSMPGHTFAWKRMMDGLGVECDRDEFYLYEGMTGAATINLLFKRAFGEECEPGRVKDLYALKSQYFKELGPAKPMPGADRMLSLLGEAGLTRVLVTGSGQASLLEALQRDYPGVFGKGRMITAHDVTHGKPDPEPYLKGAALAGLVPSECIVVENAPLGVRAGKAAGCFTVAVTTGPIPREAFEREGADMIFESMEAFADFLQDNFQKA
jgi:HAD superfamily hydrolase (TIGR01509 family)